MQSARPVAPTPDVARQRDHRAGGMARVKGNGGHGLANLKQVLNLDFHHHDAGEDARAAAMVVLRAQMTSPRFAAKHALRFNPVQLSLPL